MRGRKFLAVGICGMVGLGLAQGVSAANISTNDVPVNYNYTGAAEPVSPNYAIDIPTGLVFDAKNPDHWLDTTVAMTASQGNENIVGACKAKISVSSANGYKVAIGGVGGTDPVPYVITYGDTDMPATGAETEIGILTSGVTGENTKLSIEGRARLKGVATLTGNHTDKLTYKISNEATS